MAPSESRYFVATGTKSKFVSATSHENAAKVLLGELLSEGLNEKSMSFVVFASIVDFFTKKATYEGNPEFLGDHPRFIWTSDVLDSMLLYEMAERVRIKMREMAYLS